MIKELNAIITIAYRDFAKFLRDRQRVIFSFIFPILFIGVLGGSLNSSLPEVVVNGTPVKLDFLTFVFTGVLAQTLFQSTASGIISLVADREEDFAQEMFISPISRYSILIGKVLGETLVSLAQGIGVVFFGLLLGAQMSGPQLLAIAPTLIIASFVGGAFGVIVVANLNSQKAANQIFSFVMFPQLFLAGVFTLSRDLPLPIMVLSRITPMTYAVDLTRSVFYANDPLGSFLTLNSPLVNLAVLAVFFVLFITIGTFLFVRNERNR